MNPTGRLASFDAATGREGWAVDLKERFGATYGIWAMSENVLLEGDLLMVTPGGAKGRLAALDRKTGGTVWINTDVPAVEGMGWSEARAWDELADYYRHTFG